MPNDTTQHLKPLPAGIATFRKIVENGYLYVDKTEYLYELIRNPGGVYFVSRPRRFGKSLVVSTLEEIFLGNRDLFTGLWIDGADYDWQSYPVIRIDFSTLGVDSAEKMETVIIEYVQDIAKANGLTFSGTSDRQFQQLIAELSQIGKVVILIDEYDKPIIDNLYNVEEAKRIRTVLKAFYGVIKAMDRHLQVVFLTGVSKFSKVGVFSDLNNLEYLTMRPSFATALGITEDELRSLFNDHLDALAATLQMQKAALLDKIRYWYNGFRFAERGESVYNPFSLLLLFKEERFDNFWFATGTPTFLVNLIRDNHYGLQDVTEQQLGHLAFGTYEIERLDIAPLLFQTGYLTIKGYDPERRLYDLYYPNFEVEDAFLTYLLGSFTEVDKGLSEGYIWQLITTLQQADLTRFFSTLRIFFAKVPSTIRLKQEKYYQTIFHIIFTLIGLRVAAEVTTDQGRIDSVVELAGRIYLFEFKMDGSAETALNQIKTHQYATKYLNDSKPIHLVGVNFTVESGAISEWQEEVINSPQEPTHVPN